MRRWMNTGILTIFSVIVFAAATGCSRNEHRKVQVREEEQRSEVVEEKPGEMVVE